MKIGIVGLPNVGKSTLFNALTKSYSADAANFPFCTIEPNIGIVSVKDDRIDKLAELSKTDPNKKIYATIEFVDIAGLVRGAGKGEGLGNKFLSHIREVDAIVQVLRHFEDSDISHVEGDVNIQRDVNIINDELVFADLEQLDKKLPAIIKKSQTSGDKIAKQEAELLQKINEVLQNGKMINTILDELTIHEKKLLKTYNFLTIKPMIYAINVSQENLSIGNQIKEEYTNKLNASIAIVCAKLESELIDMDNTEKKEFIAELLESTHIDHIPTLDGLISLAYKTVGLMYYFTTGQKETKARTIPIGSTAPQAAGAIHSDFERGFIKAEIVSYKDLLGLGSRNQAKEKGKVKLEGKEYIVQDGDVIIFKFNV